jgi:starch synthase
MSAPSAPGVRGGTVVHLVGEYWPFARTGGLAEAARGLAEHQARSGTPVAIVMPLYRSVRQQTDDLAPVTPLVRVRLGPREEEVRIYRYTGSDVGPEVFFVEHPSSFDRNGIYGDRGADYPDNLERFALFCRAALDQLPRILPDAGVLHAHDWHTALASVYLRVTLSGQPFYDRLGTVLTAHNAAYQGHFGADCLAGLGLPAYLYDWRYLEWYGHVNVLKGGLAFSDLATTVSPNHAAELRTSEGGFGLHGQFTWMGDRFTGILNGIDTAFWDPTSDPYLTAPYSIDDLAPKKKCKAALQRAYGLPRRSRTPVIVMSARLVKQKGFDLLLQEGLLTAIDAQYVFLGRGEPGYEQALVALARRAPDRIAVPLTFTERLEHRLLAGADMLMMPSQFEPCGLTQMRAQRYGTIPVVRRVGGLTNTVRDGETGFLFDEYDAAALGAALERAVAAYHERDVWHSLIDRAMREDFSWAPSAAQYAALYERARAAHASDAPRHIANGVR